MEIKYAGKKYVVEFGLAVHLIDGRQITTCTILNQRHQVFTGAAVKAPSDTFNRIIGQKTALRRAFGEVFEMINEARPWPRAWEEFRVAVLGAEPD